MNQSSLHCHEAKPQTCNRKKKSHKIWVIRGSFLSQEFEKLTDSAFRLFKCIMDTL
jgi:hypothetical protein